MTELDNQKQATPFERIRQVDEQGEEFWSARDLSKVLGYNRWERFPGVIKKAQIACQKSKENVENHFRVDSKMVVLGSGAERPVKDWRLSRYACYLVVQNADPDKEIVALGQTYFAIQTHRQELADVRELSGEDYKRIFYGRTLNEHTLRLAEQAALAGIITPEDFAIFQDHGYIGLYGGLTAHDIRILKELASDQNIVDYMGSEELADNIFRVAQTKTKLERDEVRDQDTANLTHFQVGNKVRQTIDELQGNRPETLPKPGISLKELQNQQLDRKRIEEEKAEYGVLPDKNTA